MNELLRQKHEGEESGGLRGLLSNTDVCDGDRWWKRSVLALDGDKWKVRPKDNYHRAGGNGFGINDECVMYTINTVDRHIVAVV